MAARYTAAMIDHISLRTSDFDRSKKFYAAALAPLGYTAIMEYPGAAGFGEGGKPDFWLGGSPEGVPHKQHIAFLAKSREAVDQFYAAAIAAGAQDNGKPGVRAEYHPNYYAAFILDPDGHNIEVVIHK
jgi:catechol 2,3-dioxygenase-like lactoylglutathione lyase family enzyme